MARWTCPACDREFARARQSHSCVPGGSVEAAFAGRPVVYRAIYGELIGHLRGLGPVHEDAVQVGVFLKHDRKLAEVRPMARSLSVAVYLPRPVHDPRVVRSLRVSATGWVHDLRLHTVTDVDDGLRSLLTEAYLEAGD